MKFSIMSLGLMAISTVAVPTPSMIAPRRAGLSRRTILSKRAASLEDVATTGFATLNGGTSGGKGGEIIEVSTLSDLQSAVKGDDAAIILITGPIRGSGESVKVGSNKSIIGKDSKVVLENFTITVKRVNNVILRNFALQKVVGGDAIAIDNAQNIWVDHVELSSDMDHDKDFYDGLLDITHAADFVTVSNTFMHDHVSLIPSHTTHSIIV
jgi:pectate lyase